MTIVYLKGPIPDSLEQKALNTLGRASVRNVKRWKGEIESCEMVVSAADEVLNAYSAKGIKVQKIAPVKKAPAKKTPAKKAAK